MSKVFKAFDLNIDLPSGDQEYITLDVEVTFDGDDFQGFELSNPVCGQVLNPSYDADKPQEKVVNWPWVEATAEQLAGLFEKAKALSEEAVMEQVMPESNYHYSESEIREAIRYRDCHYY